MRVIVAEWNMVLNGYIRYDIVSTKFDMGAAKLYQLTTTPSLTILNIDPGSSIIPPVKNEGDAVDAFAYQGKWIYMVSSRMPTMEEFGGVLRHEISHTLGANHIDRKRHLSLMNPVYSNEGNACVDYWTVQEVARANGIDSNKLNYCHSQNR